METRRPTVPAAEEILGQYFPVLDHGFISLVDYMGTDADIEQAARVSYGAGTRQTSMTNGLIRYLRRHHHTTPTEMVELKFHCAMPIFIARQWIRHRTASVNEQSARYSIMPLLFYTPEADNFARQSKSNKQGREGGAPPEVYQEAIQKWENLRALSSETYKGLLAEDVARELARIDLPLSLYTQWYWKIDLHNMMHFLGLRAESHAQLEIQMFARVMATIMKRVAPLSYGAWIDYDFLGCNLSRMERTVLSDLLEATPNDGVVVKQGAQMFKDRLKARGLSEREITEFLAKIKAPEPVDFELDLASAKSAEYMAKVMEEALPNMNFE